jgi:hypothetical protein
MPIAGFICPDGKTVETHICLKECRLKHLFKNKRCKALPLLRRASREREWNGIPSVTQLLCGTREVFLKITKPYYIKPYKRISSIIGTSVHSGLHRLTDSEYAEETLYNDLIQGTYDMYDPYDKTLYDYKTWGTWKVAKALNGSITERADALFDVTVQMNHYRMLLQAKYPELEINNIAVQVISRETNLKQAKEKGLEDGAPVILIPKIPDRLILEFQRVKTECLHEALQIRWAPQCNSRATWNGKKCNEYCDVLSACLTMPKSKEYDTWWLEQEKRIYLIETEIISHIANYLTAESFQQEEINYTGGKE